MIHFTVAAPLGIDSLFFSFVQRLAVQNGHPCLDPPAQHLDQEASGYWIDGLQTSGQHHFVIGYRYPPVFWERIAAQASTVCLLADPEGIGRQVEMMRLQSIEGGGDGDLASTVGGIRAALEATVSLAEWLQNKASPKSALIPPATAFQKFPHEAFRRLEQFYRQAGVDVQVSCHGQFSEEAIPHLQQHSTVRSEKLVEIQRMLALDQASPSRLNALTTLFQTDG